MPVQVPSPFDRNPVTAHALREAARGTLFTCERTVARACAEALSVPASFPQRRAVRAQDDGRPGPASAGPEETRRQLLETITILQRYPPYAGPDGGQSLADLRRQVLAMTAEQLGVLGDPITAAKLSEAVASLRASAALTTLAKAPAAGAAPAVGAVLPAIPTFTPLADLPYSSLCGGPDSPNSVNAENNMLIAAEAADGAAIAAQAGCDSLVVFLGEGTNVPACIAAGIAHGVSLAARSLYDHASLCDGDINSVITRGIYEGLALVHDKVDGTFRREIEDRLLRCETLVSLRLPAALGGQIEMVHEVVETFLTQVTQAGDVHPRTLEQARSRIDSAVAKLGQARYIDAYQDYCMAYRFLAMQAR